VQKGQVTNQLSQQHQAVITEFVTSELVNAAARQ